jgi:hypothetical protein
MAVTLILTRPAMGFERAIQFEVLSSDLLLRAAQAERQLPAQPKG